LIRQTSQSHHPRNATAAPAEDARADNALAIVRRLVRTRQLPVDLAAVLDGPLADAVATAADYAGDAITAATRAAYLGDWAEFAAWCRAQQVDPTVLLIHPVLVAAYLAGLAGTIGRSALRRRVAAIIYHHRRRGLVWSSQQVAIRETLIGIARHHGRPARPAAALTSVEIKQLIAGCVEDLPGLRDRALAQARQDHARPGAPRHHRARHHRGPPQRRRRAQDPAAPRRTGQADGASERAAVAARAARRPDHRGLSGGRPG
jgi:hypothetical protein